MVQGTMLKLSDRQCDCGAAGCRHMKLKAQCFLAITNLNATQQLQNTQILYFNSGLVHGHITVSSIFPSPAAPLCFYFLATVSDSFFSLFFSSRGNFSQHFLHTGFMSNSTNLFLWERERNSCISEDWSVISRGYCLQVRGPICYFVTYDLCSITVMISFLQKPVSDKSQRLLLKSNF